MPKASSGAPRPTLQDHFLILISGKPASGKTSLASSLAAADMRFCNVSTSAILRAEVRDAGNGGNGINLQEVGAFHAELMSTGAEPFWVHHLKIKQHYVIDSIRTLDEVHYVANSTARSIHVHLYADHATRLDRFIHRSAGDAGQLDFENRDMHPVEALADRLGDLADLVFDTGRVSLRHIAREIRTHVPPVESREER